jgi:hypothetical protein
MKHLIVLAAVLTTTFALGLAAPAQAQTPPPSLVGEQFDATTASVTTSTTCNPTGTSTITFDASGPAFGPYSGTFVEHGTATFGPQTQVTQFGVSFGPIIRFDASFTIFSPTGEVLVTGTKELNASVDPINGSPPIPFGICDRVVGLNLTQDIAVAGQTYDATIQTPNGSFRDHGTALSGINIANFCTTIGCEQFISFGESFLTSSGVLPLDTTGKATGGGQLGDILDRDHVTFGFEVKQPELGKLQGRCLVNDSASNTRVKCLDVTSYSQIGNTATWTGHAEVNGVRQDYRITVQDNGEPNQGTDTFAFDSDSYDVAGNVQNGNIRLHKQTP